MNYGSEKRYYGKPVISTVKLSDNLAKALGAQEDIERFKKIFGYT